ncbi:MAG: sigma 54-interacting transcriptional regulator [Candidatus Aminicenantales bacterium]
MVARNIHELIGGKGFPFVAVNCASLAENLAEAELFGYKKGAFTDTREDRIGLGEAACRGRVFFDEREGNFPLSSRQAPEGFRSG